MFDNVVEGGVSVGIFVFGGMGVVIVGNEVLLMFVDGIYMMYGVCDVLV